MLNTSTYLRNSTPLFERPMRDVKSQRLLIREASMSATSNPNAGTRRRSIAQRDWSWLMRTESLMLVPIWVGSATAVLAAMAELVRSV